MTVGILTGSVRPSGNGAGIASWLQPCLRRILSSSSSPTTSSTSTTAPVVTTIDLGALALPFFDGDTLPAQITTPDAYAHDAVRQWSRRLASLDVVVIVTPQFNWGYPAVLKNAIDWLYHEWRAKPVLLVTYGSRGGGKAAAQLRQVLEGGLKARVLRTTLEIALDKDMVAGQRRVTSDWEGLEPHETVLEEAVQELLQQQNM
ncbi:NADPH-dependent FMN reductase domain containing protein [Acanthamoeba castellanii str. Neff]|uniref:NADPH-dependent FMN reductase domain containing protein n=1 Tax=Acanthamoeba castellanii (strain ATCC 30010 / Neff) TaxID=1257118 RepID=L8HFK0_ACACF|nr:NADPH-dependent FMN reductase domain containing protein [Acanthamoeba castellanii str. Neff]ELR24022.1 NADPH-dependent FMN reductase domain containing protein [Acanthamoeba castellanii str. Neff]